MSIQTDRSLNNTFANLYSGCYSKLEVIVDTELIFYGQFLWPERSPSVRSYRHIIYRLSKNYNHM